MKWHLHFALGYLAGIPFWIGCILVGARQPWFVVRESAAEYANEVTR